MVKKIISSFGKEIGSLHEAAYLLAVFAFLSQVVALFRDRFLAHYFGAGAELDVYYAAFRVPDLIFVSVASLVSMSVLIPYIQEKLSAGKEETKHFIDQIFSSFSIVIVAVSLLAFALMPHLISFLFAGFNSSLQAETTALSRILLLSPIFMGLSNLLGSITQAYKRFLVYAATPLVYNLSILLGLALFYPTLGLSGVVLGVVIGAMLHALIQFPFVKSVGLLPDFVFPISFKVIKSVSLISLPRTIALSLSNIAIVVLVAIASRLEEGSISIFNLSYNLQAVPLTIVGMSYSMAAFPVLSKFFVSGEKRKFMDHVATASKHIIFLSLPVAALFIVLRAQVVRTVLGSGEFSWSDTRLTAACLALFALSVVFQSLSLLFIRAFYASGMTKVPLLINSVSSIFMVGFPILTLKMFENIPATLHFFEALFRVSGVSGTMVLAIPLGFSVGVLLNAFLLWVWFEKKIGMIGLVLRKTVQDSLMASIVAGFAAYLSLQFLEKILNLETLMGIATQGFCAGLIGIIVWASVLWLLKNKELEEMVDHISKKIFKAKPVPGEPLDL